MSLVNEALKKARADAARQEALEKGVQVTATPTHLPYERRASSWPLVAIALGLALLIVVLGIVIGSRLEQAVARSGALQADAAVEPNDGAGPAGGPPSAALPTSEAAPVAASETSTVRGAAVDPSAADSSSGTPPADGGGSTPRDSAGAESPGAEAIAPQRSGRPQRRARTLAEPAGDEAAATADTAPSSEDEVGPVESARLLTAELPDGGTLRLAGITWSPSNPLAMVNGQMLRPGDVIEGFEVVQIGQTAVELSDGRQTIVLRVR